MDDCYRILGIDAKASQNEVKKAYKELAKNYHPDLNKSRNAEYLFIKIKEAYEILSDPERRKSHDIEMGYYYHAYDDVDDYYANNATYEEPANHANVNYDDYAQPNNHSEADDTEAEVKRKREFNTDLMLTIPFGFVLVLILTIPVQLLAGDFDFLWFIKFTGASIVIGIILGFIFSLINYITNSK